MIKAFGPENFGSVRSMTNYMPIERRANGKE